MNIDLYSYELGLITGPVLYVLFGVIVHTLYYGLSNFININ